MRLPYISISLSTQDKNEAWKYAQEMLRNGMFSRFGLSEKQRMDKAYIGRLGEIAFEIFLDDNGVYYEPGTYNPKTHSDNGDVIINNYSIDVKTARTSRDATSGWVFGYPVEQKPSDKDAVIIANLTNNDSELRLFGIISGFDVSNCPISQSNSFSGASYMTQNYEIPYSQLEPDILSYIETHFLMH